MSEMAPGRLDWIRAAMDAYQGRLIRFAARITGDLDSARDVVQDTFLRLCREDPDRTRDHLAAWLFRVCRNRAIDVRRKEGPLMPLDEEIATRLERPVPDASAEVEAGEGTRRMLALLAALPASQQEVLRLRFQENLSYKEIGEVTGRSVSHVGVLIHEGLKALRLKLGLPDSPRVMEGGRSHA
jgi:RNA polymerase sigma factor (sigma-70 family)